MKNLFCVLLILVVLNSCKPSNDKDIDKVRINRVCDNIMTYFKNEKIADVSSLLRENSSLIGREAIDTLQKQILEQFKSGAFSQYGNARSFELVKEVPIGNFAAKRCYALRFDRYYLTFIFTLYHSTKGWEITGFKYDEDSSVLY